MKFSAILLAVVFPAFGQYRVQVDDPEAWKPVLSAIGLEATADTAPLRIVVGDSTAARDAGVLPSAQRVRVAATVAERDPALDIYWSPPLEIPVYTLPEGARVFTREKRTGAPLAVGLPGAPPTLWIAAPPGESGYDRFPYLLHALLDLGAAPPLRANALWAFFDDSYRLRADPDYLARQWRRAGISALHVSAWHFHERDPERDEYLRKLIAACRRQGVLVYAWLELPHVSDRFWEENPACREQTATLQDARLDWRKLVNLVDPVCAEKVEEGVAEMLRSFAWDGVNLAELYFESLLGPESPARFTPMNDAVRRRAEQELGFDPRELFEPEGGRFWRDCGEQWAAFLDFRARLTLELQERWLAFLRETLPNAELTATQIDDRYDPRMRELLGADAGALLSSAERYDFTLLIEDPAPLWSLGPERYPEIARSYRPIAPNPARLAIDINIVERYQQTYPTRKQVGAELLRLVHEAAGAFPRTALYFEHSLGKLDQPLLPYAAHAGKVAEGGPERWVVESPRPVGVRFAGPAAVDGKLWPVGDGEWTEVPAGRREVTQAAAPPPGRVLHLNAELLDADVDGTKVVVWYRGKGPGYALLDRRPSSATVDGAAVEPEAARAHWTLRLPRGERVLELVF